MVQPSLGTHDNEAETRAAASTSSSAKSLQPQVSLEFSSPVASGIAPMAAITTGKSRGSHGLPDAAHRELDACYGDRGNVDLGRPYSNVAALRQVFQRPVRIKEYATSSGRMKGVRRLFVVQAGRGNHDRHSDSGNVTVSFRPLGSTEESGATRSPT